MLLLRVVIGLSLGLLLAQFALAAGNVYYRYINSDGVKAMSHTLSAEYAQKGYEVVSLSGKVIEVVSPARSQTDIERIALQKHSAVTLAQWDKSLRLRYSRVSDIEAAKQRKLAEINTNINILIGNVSKLSSQLQLQQGQAANAERKGYDVSSKLLSNINNLELEIKTTSEQVATRRQEYVALTDKYDRDINRFNLITQ
tara:strand:- start:680 stop:1276 length:597 start_codon:yes stop_codon:yes gene_type:complete